MYEEFYNFDDNPFRLTPDSKYIFLSKQHEEAILHLLYGIQERKGFMVLIGDIGMGKTTVCRELLNRLSEDVTSALVLNPKLGEKELLRVILEDFGIKTYADNTINELHDMIYKFLLDEASKNRNVVLIIDESQNLSAEVMEQIRLISNLETESTKLLQIILVGQNELGDLLDLPRLRQLKQRISVKYCLTGLNKQEVEYYITHRIKTAGKNPKVKFTKSAINLIYKYSKGIPRVINIICDRTLLVGFNKGTYNINKNIVQSAIKDLEEADKKRKKYLEQKKKTFLLKILSVLAIFSILFAIFAIKMNKKSNKSIKNITKSAKNIDNNINSAKKIVKLPNDTVKINEKVVYNDFDKNKIFRKENVTDEKPIILSLLNIYGFNKDELKSIYKDNSNSNWFSNYFLKEKFSLQSYKITANIGFIKRMNIPVILETLLPEKYVILSELKEKAVILSPQQGKIYLDLYQLSEYWLGKTIILLDSKLSLNDVSQGMRNKDVITIQRYLKLCGYLEAEPTGFFGPETLSAVFKFQKDNGLFTDGIAGVKTQIMLFAKALEK